MDGCSHLTVWPFRTRHRLKLEELEHLACHDTMDAKQTRIALADNRQQTNQTNNQASKQTCEPVPGELAYALDDGEAAEPIVCSCVQAHAGACADAWARMQGCVERVCARVCACVRVCAPLVALLECVLERV